jgi:hypothetical protein
MGRGFYKKERRRATRGRAVHSAEPSFALSEALQRLENKVEVSLELLGSVLGRGKWAIRDMNLRLLRRDRGSKKAPSSKEIMGQKAPGGL